MGRTAATPRLVAVLALLAALAGAACASPDALGGGQSQRPGNDGVADPVDMQWDARIDGWSIELHGPGDPVTVADVDPAEGTPVHVAVRPGDGPTATMLVVVRSAVIPGPRYVLRYLDVDTTGLRSEPGGVAAEERPTLWWLPWRLQIDAEHGTGRDTAPRPVWSPDGSTVAWVEWDADGTVLRLLDWSDDGPTATTSSPLDEVPPGLVLRTWERGDDGRDVLVGELDGEQIHLALRLITGAGRSA